MRILEGMAGLVVERQHAGGKGFFLLGAAGLRGYNQGSCRCV
jgi:hypothetical protein